MHSHFVSYIFGRRKHQSVCGNVLLYTSIPRAQNQGGGKGHLFGRRCILKGFSRKICPWEAPGSLAWSLVDIDYLAFALAQAASYRSPNVGEWVSAA